MRNFFDHDTAKAVYYVYLYKNITKAGEKLGLTQSAMSRRIQMAEERTGLLIFERGFHEMTPTKQGARYIESCKEVLHIGDAALKDAHALVGEKAKEVSILGTQSLITSWLPMALSGFNEKHPDIYLKTKSETNPVDVFESDILISLYSIDNDEVEKIRLFDQVQGLYASKKYVERLGVPTNIHELEKHSLLALNNEEYQDHQGVNWHLSYGIGTKGHCRKASMELNSNDGRYQALLNGHGIAPVSIAYVRMTKPKEIVRILPDITSENSGMYLYYNARCKATKNIEIVKNHLLSHIKNNMHAYALEAQLGDKTHA